MTTFGSAPGDIIAWIGFSFSIVSPRKYQDPTSWQATTSRHGKEENILDKHVLEITDIFRGAFLLFDGGDLCGIRMDGNGKQVATFLIRGQCLWGMGSPLKISSVPSGMAFRFHRAGKEKPLIGKAVFGDVVGYRDKLW